MMKIEKVVFGAKGMGRLNGKACFVGGVLPGEEVEIEIAWKFGKLPSYSDEYISQLISEHTN